MYLTFVQSTIFVLQERGGVSDDAMHLATFSDKELGQIGSELTSDP